MTQQQTDNKAMQLLIAAVLTNAMSPSTQGMTQQQAEAVTVTQFERWYNFSARAMLPNNATMPDGSQAHPAGVFDDPPDVDPASVVNGIAQNPGALKTLAGALAPVLALIPGAGPAAAAAAGVIASLPPIPMPGTTTPTPATAPSTTPATAAK